MGIQENLAALKTIDFAQLHVYDGDDLSGKIRSALVLARERMTLPVLVGEFGARERGVGPDVVTEGVFVSLLSGASGVLPWLQDEKDPPACYERVRAAQRFFSGVLWDRGAFAPVPEEDIRVQRASDGGRLDAPPLCLALKGNTKILLYLRRTAGEGELDVILNRVRPGRYSVELWKPETGVRISGRTTSVRERILRLRVPSLQGGVAAKIEWNGDFGK